MDPLTALWAERVDDAIRFATREHASHLQGSRFPAYDGQGLHSYSLLCGEIRALESLAPELFAHPAVQFDPLGTRQAAREGAVLDFEAEREGDWRLRALLARNLA